MSFRYPEQIWSILVCPYCRSSLNKDGNWLTCTGCGRSYKNSSIGQLDLRVQETLLYPITFDIGSSLTEKNVSFDELRKNPTPAVDWTGVKVPNHLSSEILSWFPLAETRQSMVLDLGCGKTQHRRVCEYAGFNYIGLDYDSIHAPILGDAQSLPFCDDSFEFILSIAVLEHIRFPFVAMSEAFRVLTPGGVFIGTVAFLEGFHSRSLYHHTHLGVLNSLDFAGFSVLSISPHKNWTAFAAQSPAIFPLLPHRLSRLMLYPLEITRRMWLWGGIGLIRWLRGKSISPDLIASYRATGAFTFIAYKPIPKKSGKDKVV